MNRWYKSGKELLNEIKESNPLPQEAYIWFTGQHGFIIKLADLVFYIDVILNELINEENGTNLRVFPPPFQPGEVQAVDYVLCTHNHIDHLNLETLLPLSKANPHTRFIIPAPCKNILIGAGIHEDRIISAKVNNDILIKNDKSSDSVTVKPLPAFHTLQMQDEIEKDENGDSPALGFILKTDGISIYHSGDTWMTPSLLKALKSAGRIDISMLPINGADEERTSQNIIGNMGPLEAVKLAEALDIDLVIPAHYDLIAHNSENPSRFAEVMYERCPQKRFHIFAPGERFVYRK